MSVIRLPATREHASESYQALPDQDAIAKNDEDSQWQFVYGPLLRQGCFYCGQPFEAYPVIQWCGAAGESIFLHPVCCHELTDKLRADLRTAYIAPEPCGASLTEGPPALTVVQAGQPDFEANLTKLREAIASGPLSEASEPHLHRRQDAKYPTPICTQPNCTLEPRYPVEDAREPVGAAS